MNKDNIFIKLNYMTLYILYNFTLLAHDELNLENITTLNRAVVYQGMIFHPHILIIYIVISAKSMVCYLVSYDNMYYISHLTLMYGHINYNKH